MGFRDHGKPVLRYSSGSAAPGISNGVPVVTGAEHGVPEIAYQPAQDGSADRSFANGGVPDAPGAGGITYTRPMAPPPQVAAAPVMPTQPEFSSPPGERPVPRVADVHLAAADQALKNKRPVAAREELELAETRLLNARRDGEYGWRHDLGVLADARNAVIHRNGARAASNIAPRMTGG